MKKLNGKTYVMSDIHGKYGSYEKAMSELTNEDKIYIVGDVLDRGKGGIKIIQDIMDRQKNPDNNPKITFLAGNHEMQFLEVVYMMKKKGILEKDKLVCLVNMKRYERMLKIGKQNADEQTCQMAKEKMQKINQQFQDIVNKSGLTKHDLTYIDIWINCNGGENTIVDFIEKKPEEKKEIFNFIVDSYVALPQKIKGKDYLFVHAMPPKDSKMLQKMRETGQGYKFVDLSQDEYRFMLEERENETYKQSKNYGFTTICGHTPNYGTIEKNEKDGYIRVDAGCGHRGDINCLALYCIDDDKVEYIEQMEQADEIKNEIEEKNKEEKSELKKEINEYSMDDLKTMSQFDISNKGNRMLDIEYKGIVNKSLYCYDTKEDIFPRGFKINKGKENEKHIVIVNFDNLQKSGMTDSEIKAVLCYEQGLLENNCTDRREMSQKFLADSYATNIVGQETMISALRKMKIILINKVKDRNNIINGLDQINKRIDNIMYRNKNSQDMER